MSEEQGPENMVFECPHCYAENEAEGDSDALVCWKCEEIIR